jgi:hypothetical protein
LEKFVLGDDELSRKSSDRLQKYTGVTIPPTSLMRCTRRFTTFIETYERKTTLRLASTSSAKQKRKRKKTRSLKKRESCGESCMEKEGRESCGRKSCGERAAESCGRISANKSL